MQQDQIHYGSFEVYNGLGPLKKPRTLPLNLDFSIINPLALDLTLAQTQDKIEFVQAVYVDNSLNPFPLTLIFSITGQSLSWPAYSQGYLPTLTPNSPRFIASTVGTPIINIQMLTFPMPAAIWPVVNTQVARLISLGSANATVVKASPGQVFSWNMSNINAAPAYVKIYDKATTPVVGTDIPKLTITLPGSAAGALNISDLLEPAFFSNGISFAIVTGAADNNNTGVAAGDVVINLMYQ